MWWAVAYITRTGRACSSDPRSYSDSNSYPSAPSDPTPNSSPGEGLGRGSIVGGPGLYISPGSVPEPDVIAWRVDGLRPSVVVPQIGAELCKPRGGQIGRPAMTRFWRALTTSSSPARSRRQNRTLSPPDPTADSAPSWNSTVNFDPR